MQFDERTELRRRLTAGESLSVIASALGRQTSTISREVSRNGGVLAYRPWKAQLRANRLARRPKAFKLERHRKLARWVSEKLELRWSPEQIAGRLRRDHPHDPRWWVSAETIYQSLYVQARGGLNEELTRYLRTRRPKRRASQANRGHGQLNDMVMISERPPEADDRRVPGHWEGDLLQGGRNSQIATLVERTSRYLIPVALPDGRTAPLVAAALSERIHQLPEHLKRSLTWDQGKEMAQHVTFSVATGVPVYFCEPAKPWQRGTNENTNRLLRDYFPKGHTDFRTITIEELDQVAHELNNRPRKVLDYRTPAEAYAEAVALTP
ncbi:MAG: IS30 family transposase [Acidimicrobiales bacterium]